jgi:hypothetical protein
MSQQDKLPEIQDGQDPEVIEEVPATPEPVPHKFSPQELRAELTKGHAALAVAILYCGLPQQRQTELIHTLSLMHDEVSAQVQAQFDKQH